MGIWLASSQLDQDALFQGSGNALPLLSPPPATWNVGAMVSPEAILDHETQSGGRS
jgi:hypothetical protein